AVSNMERYVQFGFEPALRLNLFGDDWSILQVDDFEQLEEVYYKYKQDYETKNSTELSIDEIIARGKIDVNQSNAEIPDRFTSPINFQNLILRNLHIKTKNEKVSLDIKKLIDAFKNENNSLRNEVRKFPKEFKFQLLNSKFLMDKYGNKRQF